MRLASLELMESSHLKPMRKVLPSRVCTSDSMERLLQKALQNPIDSPAFEDERPEKVAIVFSDATRHCSPFVQQLLRLIAEKTDDIKLVSAHGAHAPCDFAFVERVLGEELYACYKNDVLISSTQNPSSSYERIGETSRGTPVELNRALLDRDLIVSSLNVQPHYFAGYEGGAKILLPGCASLRSILANHSLVIGNPNSKELRIRGNDVREDLNESSGLLAKHGVKHRIVDFVLDQERNVFHIGYGNPVSVHGLVAETYSRQIYSVKTQPSRLVVAVAESPSGKNLYQALKAAAFASNMVTEGLEKKSVVVLLATLEDGIGGQALEYEMERYSGMEPSEILEDLRGRAREGKITEASQKLNRLAMDDSKMDLVIVSPDAPKEVEKMLNKTKYKFFRHLDEALETLDQSIKKDAAVLPNGSSTVPII